MAQNTSWWQGRPTERYWLEATDRPDIGTNLKAPLKDAAGRTNWRYTLFLSSAPDDIVFHYDAQVAAITGWSRIAGAAENRAITWAARGSYARERGAKPEEIPGYIIPLDSHTKLEKPLTLEDIRASKAAIGNMVEELSGNKNVPLYFPFELSDRPLRPLQGYAFKLPAEFVNAFSQLRNPEPPARILDANWSDEELAVCVEAYVSLLDQRATGESMNGSELTRRVVARLPGRSEGAVIRRLQSITTVLQSRGQPFLARFEARDQVGAGVAKRIAELLAEIQPTADPIELEQNTQSARARFRVGLSQPPAGNRHITWTRGESVRYRRRADVRAWVLLNAGNTCEACLQAAPFFTDEGEPYLEVHHVQPLRFGGPDTCDNTLAVCPTCHRRLHLAKDRAVFRLEIIGRISRLVDYPALNPPADAEMSNGEV